MKWAAVGLLLVFPLLIEANDFTKDLDQVETWIWHAEYQKALDAAKAIAAKAKEAKDDQALARAYYLIADTQYYIGNYAEYKQYCEKAVNAYLKINDTLGVAKSYYELSYIYVDEPEDMLKILDKADSYASKTKVLWIRGVIQNAYGMAYQNSGNYRKAISHFEAAATIAEKDSDVTKQSISLSNAGASWSYLGEYQQALRYYDRALAIGKTANNKRPLAAVLARKGETQLALGDTDEALSCFREALAIHERSGYLKGQLYQLQDIADVYKELQETEEFLKYSNRALVLAEKIGRDTAAFYTLIQMAETLSNEGRISEAQAYLERAQIIAKKTDSSTRIEISSLANANIQLRLKHFKEAHQSLDTIFIDSENHDNAYFVGHVCATRAAIYEAEGNFQAAIDAYQKAFDLYERMGTLRELALWSGKIAELNFKIGNDDNAQKYFQKSLSYIDKLDSILIMDRFRINLFKDVSNIYESYASWLAVKGLYEQAWNVLEQGRTRDLTLRIEQAQGSSSITEPERDALGRLTELQRSLREEELSKSERTDLLEKISSAEAQYEQAVYIVESKKNSARKPYTLHFPQQHCLLVEYAVKNDEILIFSYLNSFISFRRISPAERVLQKSIAFYQQATRFSQPIDSELNNELFRILLEPELKNWNSGRIIIVPDDILSFIPFSALISKDGKYLAEKYAITTIPSLEIYHRLNLDKQTYQSKAAAIANTTFQFAEQSPFQLPALPGAEKEMEMLAKNIKDCISILNGSESRIKQMDFSHFKLMHFATHALMNEAHPERSCIVLAADKDEDGYLQAREIYRMKLSQMVVLSACRSGTGKIVSGEGIVGLSHAFIAAGTKTLITSMWDVSDEATVDFMAAFYDALNGNSVAEALKQAQHQMIHSSKWKHPGYWSAFTVSGIADEKLYLSRSISRTTAFYYAGFAVLSFLAVLIFRKAVSKRT